MIWTWAPNFIENNSAINQLIASCCLVKVLAVKLGAVPVRLSYDKVESPFQPHDSLTHPPQTLNSLHREQESHTTHKYYFNDKN